MTDRELPGRCSNCNGVAIDRKAPRCFIHADDSARMVVLLSKLKKGGDCWFTQGTNLHQDDLDLIFSYAPVSAEGRRILRRANFRGCIFETETRFATAHDTMIEQGVEFEGFCDFQGAQFLSDVDFSGAIFRNYIDFKYATFRGTTLFERCAFLEPDIAPPSMADISSFEVRKAD